MKLEKLNALLKHVTYFTFNHSFLPLLTRRLCRNIKEATYWKGGEAVGWKRFRAVTVSRSNSGVPSL